MVAVGYLLVGKKVKLLVREEMPKAKQMITWGCGSKRYDILQVGGTAVHGVIITWKVVPIYSIIRTHSPIP